jgi:uncharacterized protein
MIMRGRRSRPWYLIGIWVALLCLPSLAWSGGTHGVEAYQRGDYTTAYREFLPLAQQGNAAAQHLLGDMYQDGQGVPQDYVEAAKWYRNAAEQGFADAQASLGGMYYVGRGVPLDRREAMTWFRKAAEQGSGYGAGMLGFIYAEGHGVPQDYIEAAKWYRKAAEQGNTLAQLTLGAMYADGRGVPQDYVQAHLWLNLAAARFSPGEHHEYWEKAVKARNSVAAWMTPAQITEAQRLAQEWWQKHP